MSLKTLMFPNDVSVNAAAKAWGSEPQELLHFLPTSNVSSHEIRKYLMKTTTFIYPGKTRPVVKELFVRFMVLSLKYPLFEDMNKALLQMLGRDYLRPDDEVLFRKKCEEIHLTLGTRSSEQAKLQRYLLDYYHNVQGEYIADFPKRVFVDTLKESPVGSFFGADSKANPAMGLNLAICIHKMGVLIRLIPIVDKASLEIIEANSLFKSVDPVIGALRLRRPIAERHTSLAIN
jgi:hypothetical protein